LSFAPAASAQSQYVSPQNQMVGLPQFSFNGSFFSTVSYGQKVRPDLQGTVLTSPGLLSVDAIVSGTYLPPGFGFTLITNGKITIRTQVNSVGQLTGGVPVGSSDSACGDGNGDDFCIQGDVTINGVPRSGVLLRGEAYSFGFKQNGWGTANVDDFEFNVQVTSGDPDILAAFAAMGYVSPYYVAVPIHATNWVDATAPWSPAYAAGVTNPFTQPFTEFDAYGWLGASNQTGLLTQIYTAAVQSPIKLDGSLVVKKKSTVPVKFTLAAGGVPTCTLPPATISLELLSSSAIVNIDPTVYDMPSDVGNNFRIDTAACQYVYNLTTTGLSTGTYRVRISIAGSVVGSGQFGVK
jgi:hypothetical protein